MDKQSFINYVAEIAVRDWNERRIMLPSVVIAQACKESAFGMSELAINANALFGIKLNDWDGPCYRKKADEQNPDGSFRTDPDALWRKYESWEQSILDHSTYIATRKVGNQSEPNFKAIVGETNVKKVIAGFVGDPNRYATSVACKDPELRQCVLEGKSVYPYATGINYPQSLLDDYILKYNLTKYDTMEVVKMSKKVFLSAGHGGSNPGAVAFGLKEKDINLQTLLACKAELERHGVEVIASRVIDENDDVYEEVREANASGAEIAVSFHANAGGGDGFEAFYYVGSSKGEKLAKLGEKYVKELGQNSRGVKSGNHLYFVRKTDIPAVLFESFFMDNEKDKSIGDTIEEQKKFGVAYAKAILEYFEIAYKSEEVKEDSDKIYRVQVGAFKVKANAEKLQAELKAKGYSTIIV